MVIPLVTKEPDEMVIPRCALDGRMGEWMKRMHDTQD